MATLLNTKGQYIVLSVNNIQQNMRDVKKFFVFFSVFFKFFRSFFAIFFGVPSGTIQPRNGPRKKNGKSMKNLQKGVYLFAWI